MCVLACLCEKNDILIIEGKCLARNAVRCGEKRRWDLLNRVTSEVRDWYYHYYRVEKGGSKYIQVNRRIELHLVVGIVLENM